MSEKKESLGNGHLGEVVRVGDIEVRRGTVIKTEDNKLFFSDHQLPKERNGKKTGTLVTHRVITASDGTMLGRSPRKTMIDPDEMVTPAVIMLYSMADRILPVIRETRKKRKKEPETSRRTMGFNTGKK